MVVEFTVGNFLSFHEQRTISFKAEGIAELKENLISVDKIKYKLLPSIVVYGANSSGKSNLIKAMNVMQSFVLNSVKLNKSDQLVYYPFLLSGGKYAPTYFEMVFLSNAGERFRYGFSHNWQKIVDEWLYLGNVRKEKALFLRTEEGIGVDDSFEEGKGKEEATNDNRLFLSLVAQLGGNISNQVMDCFGWYNVISGVEYDKYANFSQKIIFEKSEEWEDVQSFFQALKLGFTDIEVVERSYELSESPMNVASERKEEFRKQKKKEKRLFTETFHNKYDKDGNIIDRISWPYETFESAGTKKIISLSGPIFNTLRTGKLLVIDELDANLHPLLTVEIIRLFNNRKTNPNNAQLLFATHDTNLLSSNLFRRDQIWFTEKDKREQTDLYALQDFVLPDGSKVRSDAKLEKNYLQGRYGAIPYITH
jgi:AAA15 family ATPase/GTPase